MDVLAQFQRSPRSRKHTTQSGHQHRALLDCLLLLCLHHLPILEERESESHHAILTSLSDDLQVFNMIDIQNATLAGGVAAGSAADMVLHPSVALLVGAVSGTVSVFGFSTIQGFLERTTGEMTSSHVITHSIGIHDTCGILNLHGLPGVIGAVVSMIATAATQLYPNEYNYNQLIYVYPGRTDRSPNTQAQYQVRDWRVVESDGDSWLS